MTFNLPAPSQDTIIRALRISSFDYTDNLWWREDDEGNLRIFIMCSDVFFWGSADVEEITDENIGRLESTVKECDDLLGKWMGYDGFLLWCSRERKMRPQGAVYANIDPELWPLFNAAGPERETGLGNPHSAPVDI